MKQGFHRVGRRTMSRVALAGMLGLGLALAGCGGNDDEDETKADKQGVRNLRHAFDHLAGGMRLENVTGLVGQSPQSQSQFSPSGNSTLYTVAEWSDYSYGAQENLIVWFLPSGAIAYTQYVLQGSQVESLERYF